MLDPLRGKDLSTADRYTTVVHIKVLRMSQPWPHPSSGIYYFRQRVPANLVSVVGRKMEKISLRTRDPAEARIAFASVVAHVAQRWRRLAEGIRSLSEEEAEAIAGIIYSDMIKEHGANPSKMHGLIGHLFMDWMSLRPSSVRTVMLGDPEKSRAMLERALQARRRNNDERIDDWLQDQGLRLDPESRRLVIKAVDRAILQARELLAKRARGDYRPDPDADRFPKLVPAASQRPDEEAVAERVTFHDIIAAQAAKRQAGKNSRPLADSSVKKYVRLVNAFAEFRGSDDASTITVEEVEDWCEALEKAGILNNRSISQRIVNLGTVINWGKRQRKNRLAMATAEIISGKVELPSYEEMSADEISYTMEEGRALLRASRSETDPRKRWIPWLCVYGGLRIGEANALRTEDFRQVEETRYFLVSTSGQRRLKTRSSKRKVPVHPALANECLLDWIARLPEGRLFDPGATSLLCRWVRAVGLDREELAPNHGLRHLFVALCRRHQMNSEAETYLSGHASAKVHAKYGASDVMIPGLAVEHAKIAPLLPPGLRP